MGRRPVQVKKKHTQVGNERTWAEKGDVSVVWTLGSQVRVDAPYHFDNEPFLTKCNLKDEIK